MVTIDQVQKGFARFVDGHVVVAFDGWQKAVVGGGAALLAANLSTVISNYADHPLVGALGIFSKESGSIDIDAVYNAIAPRLGSEKIPIAIMPKITIKIGREDLATLVQYIKEA